MTLNENLLGLYPISEGIGTTTFEVSGNGNNATINGADWVGGRNSVGRALDFISGNSDNLSCGNTGTILRTISFWINLDSTTEKILELKANVYVYVSGGTLTVSGFAGTVTFYVDGLKTTTIAASSWVNVVLTSDTNEDGSAFVVGRNGATYGDFIFDELRIYSDVKTPYEIRQLSESRGLDPHDDRLRRGLVLDLRMSEGTGTVVHDVSGYGNDGAFGAGAAAPSWADGRTGFGKCLSFDGGDDYLRMADDTSFDFETTTDFSIFCWIKAGEAGTTEYLLVSDYGAPGYWTLWIWSTNVLRFTSSDGHDSCVGTVNICDGEWHHVGVVCDRDGDAQLYVDGIADGAGQAMAGGDVTTNTWIRLGSNNNNALWYEGLVDEVRMYNRTLTRQEIRRLYEQGGRV